MSITGQAKHRHSGSYYGAFSFGSVILTAYATFLGDNRFYRPAACVPLVFAFGAIYGVLGILSGSNAEAFSSEAKTQRLLRHGPRRTAWYYLTQLVLLTVIVWLSPSRGFMGIIVLPIVSQAVFDLRGWLATVITLYLFGINVALWALPYGWRGASEAVFSYATAFAFTVAFSLVAKQALTAREREAALRQTVEAANEQLRAHAAQAEELATTRERNRLAREIHDGVGHYLTVVKTQLDAAAALLPEHPDRARESVNKAARLAAEALDDVRRSVGTLRTDVARPPLPEALRTLTTEIGLPVALKIDGEQRPLPSAVEHALFRSAQEGLTNVRKHSGASTAEVMLDFRRADRVELTVIDDGKGAEDTASGGFGLRGIRERIEILGGRVECGNGDGGGFQLRVEVPV